MSDGDDVYGAVYERGEVVFREGELGDLMYIIQSGVVEFSHRRSDAEEVLAVAPAGVLFGEMALFERAPRSASVKTLTPVRLLALSRSDFIGLLRKSPDLAMAVIQELSRRLRTINEQASALSFQRVKDRTKGLLERLAREPQGDGGRRRTPSLTHQQIADMIGTSRETGTRVVKELKTDGWLEQEGKHYLVPSDAPSG